MNAKISVFVVSVKAIISLLIYNLHDCAFKMCKATIKVNENNVDSSFKRTLFYFETKKFYSIKNSELKSVEVDRKCSVKRVLKMSQNSQENTCAGVSYNKVAGLMADLFSCEFCGIFQNIYFVEYFRTDVRMK